MNRRERVLAALNHKSPDRVPVDLGGMGSTGIMGVAYARFREHLNLPHRRVRLNDVGQQLAELHEDMLEWCGVDVLNIARTLPPAHRPKMNVMKFPLLDLSCDPPETLDSELLKDGLRLKRKDDGWAIVDRKGWVEFIKPDTSYYFDRVANLLAEASTVSDIAAFDWSLPKPAHFATLQEQAKSLRDTTDFALMGSFGGSILETGQSLRGWGQFMIDLASGGPFLDYLLEFITDRWMEHLGLFLEAVGDFIDVIVFGDDLGTQAAPQLSVDMYRETIHPRHKRLYQYVREHYPNVHVFLHSCGSIRDLIPLLIDEGVQILNPVQTSAAGMDPVELKREYGRDLVFWGGGMDTQSVLPTGTPEQVRKMTLERMEILGEGGGFVFCQVHNIQASVPPENILAMYQATREFNKLPLLPERAKAKAKTKG